MELDQLRGHVDSLIMAVLADGPAHGYAISEAITSRSDGVFSVTEGALYPALHRLERRGHLSSTWTARGGRRRRVYALTLDGRLDLDAKRSDWATFMRSMQAVLGS